MFELGEGIEGIFPMFSEDNYSEALDLIKRFSLLIPSDKSKIDYLNTILTYVDGIINGDAIHQYVTYESISSLAKQAFKEIMDDVHENVLNSYSVERMNLQEEVSALLEEKNGLDIQVKDLQESKTSLNIELDSLTVNISNLKQELEALLRSKEELALLISDYNSVISKLSEGRKETKIDNNGVIWRQVSEDDSILSILYDATNNNIYDFINSLKEEYMDNTGIDKFNCDKDFEENSPSLSLIPKLMLNLISAHYASLNYILHYDYTDSSEEYDVIRLKRAIEDLKIPVYSKNISKNTEKNNQSDINAVFTDASSIKRELYFQRIAMESMTKERILEFQFNSLLEAISTTLPVEYVKPLLDTYSEITKGSISESEELKLKKI